MANHDDDDDDFDDGEAAEEEEFAEEELAGEDDFEEPVGPKPRASLLTVILCLLNVAATIGFAVLLVMDYSKRQEWSFAVFMRDLALEGLPLVQEADGPSASRQTMPEQRIDADKLKDAFRKRGGSVSERFVPVFEVFPNRILPQHLSDETLKIHFKNAGTPVRTLEEEIERLRKTLPDDIKKAAQEFAAKPPDEKAKRDQLALTLLPLARTPKQIDDLYTFIQKVDGVKLDELLVDAGQRRVLYDILAPHEFFRPAPIDAWPLEQIADIKGKKLEEYVSMLDRRLKSTIEAKYDAALHLGKEFEGKERDSIEKRQAIAFMVFTVAQARKPDGTPLYPQGPERVQKVIGLFEDAVAAGALAGATDKMTRKMVNVIIEDREGKPVFDPKINKLTSTDGFVHSYAKEIDRVKEIIETIRTRNLRLADVQDQEKKQADIVDMREKQIATVSTELIGERKKTSFQLGELRRLQKQLFDAQVKLADAHQNNLRLEQAIRRAELRLKGDVP